jgi:hypothetical protein
MPSAPKMPFAPSMPSAAQAAELVNFFGRSKADENSSGRTGGQWHCEPDSVILSLRVPAVRCIETGAVAPPLTW